MSQDIRIAISCPDRTGLLSALAGRLFDLGADMGDASFAVLGQTAEFAAVARLPENLSLDDIRSALEDVEELGGAQIDVTAIVGDAPRADSGHVTHRVEIRGADQPGLVARLTEAFADYKANIVRMDCERVPSGTMGDYLIRIEAWIPESRAATCLAAVDSTAQALGLSSHAEPV